MKTRMAFDRVIVVSLLLVTAGMALSQSPSSGVEPGKVPHTMKPSVTFVELGSVKCVPCKMMQPVMASIERKYGDQIEIVFHDVWTDSGKTLAAPYKIRAIPTQVFLDGKGVEFHRHEGYYPESEIDKLLQRRGLKVMTPPAK